MEHFFLVGVFAIMKTSLSTSEADDMCAAMTKAPDLKYGPPVENQRLVGNPVFVSMVQNEGVCQYLCKYYKLRDTCDGYNFKTSENGLHKCELFRIDSVQQAESQLGVHFRVTQDIINGSPCLRDVNYCKNRGKCILRGQGSPPFNCSCIMEEEGVPYLDKHCNVGKSCRHWKDLGFVKSGIYNINPDGQDVITVYCDQMSDGGGWTVFQRRTSPFKLDSRRGWLDYENGFRDGAGLQKGEFWLGLRNLHRVSLTVPNGAMLRMRIELQASGGHTGYATFDNFSITGPADNYRWSMTTYSGNIGNSIYGYSHHQAWNQNGMQFTTYDRDHDTSPHTCGSGAGFWFNWCGHAHLNAAARPHWHSWPHTLNTIGSTMMLR